MLAKQARLTTKEFEARFCAGKNRPRPLFLIITTDDQSSSKCSVAVGKKVAKTAVMRNRLRRQLYATIATTPYLTEFPKRHTIIVLKPAAATVPAAELQTAVAAALFS